MYILSPCGPLIETSLNKLRTQNFMDFSSDFVLRELYTDESRLTRLAPVYQAKLLLVQYCEVEDGTWCVVYKELI